MPVARSTEAEAVPQVPVEWYHDWVKDNIPDLAGKVAIITGSNSGTGFWAAVALAGKGATVVLACRSTEKAEAAKAEILQLHPGANIDVMRCDNMDLATVRSFASAFQQKYMRLDLLLNNAGIMAQPLIESKDGHDIQFQTNHLAHFLLTSLLWPTLKKTKGDVRVVNHSSMAHWLGNCRFDRDSMEVPSYWWPWAPLFPFMSCAGLPPDNWKRYGTSKLCNVLFGLELQRRIEAAGLEERVKSVMCHPGGAATNLQKTAGEAGGMDGWEKYSKDGQSAADGSLPLLMACFGDVPGGGYCGPSMNVESKGPPTLCKFGGYAEDEAMAEDLWEYSEEVLGINFAL